MEEPDLIDLCDSDEDEKSNINLVPPAPQRYLTTNFEKSFLHSSTGVAEEEALIAECSLCDGVFNSTAAFVKHMQSYHRLSKLFECTLCHQIFMNGLGLQYHMKTVHPLHRAQPPQANQPPHASYSPHRPPTPPPTPRPSQSSYSLPQTSHPQMSVSCEICGDKFNFQEALDAHKEVHTVEKKFSIVAENLDNEIASKKFTCSICHKKFFFETALLWHKKKKHVLLRKRGRPKSDSLACDDVSTKGRHKFTCDICEKGYPSKKSVLAHRRWHFKKDPSLMDPKLTDAGSNKNVLTPVITSKQNSELPLEGANESIKPSEFLCNLCEKSFRSKRGLSRHKYNHLSRARELQSTRKQIETRNRKRNPRKERLGPGLANELKMSIQLFGDNKAKIKNPIVNDDHETRSNESEGDSSACVDIPRKCDNSFKRFECNVCQETFIFGYNYWQHLETHRKKKILCCHVCGECFAFKCTLQSHEFLNHSSKEVSFCRFCQRPYINKTDLNIHYRLCYYTACKAKAAMLEEEKGQVDEDSLTSNPILLSQSFSSSTDQNLTTSHPMSFSQSFSSDVDQNSTTLYPMPLSQSFSSNTDRTPITSHRMSFSQSSSSVADQNSATSYSVPSNESLLSSTVIVAPKMRKTYQLLSETNDNIPPSLLQPSYRVEEGYFYCNICEKKYSTEFHLFQHVLIMHPTENYPFNPQDDEDSSESNNEENCVSSFVNYRFSQESLDCLNNEDPKECCDPLFTDAVNEPSQQQGTNRNEPNLCENTATSNEVAMNLSVSSNHAEAMKSFTEFLVTPNSSNCTSLNTMNSDLNLRSNQEHINYF